MSEQPSATASVSPVDPAWKGLQLQILVVLVALIVALSGLLLFIWRQDVLLRRDIEERRASVNQFISEYHRVSEPAIRGFVASLQAFARTHPEFNQILGRYKLDAIAPAGASVLGPTNVPVR